MDLNIAATSRTLPFGRWDKTFRQKVRIAVSRLWYRLLPAAWLDQAQANIRDQQSDAVQTSFFQVIEDTQATGLVLLLAFTHAQNPPSREKPKNQDTLLRQRLTEEEVDQLMIAAR